MKFLLFGLIQSITEFLPISSSGHLYLLKKIFSLKESLLPFFVFLHIPTLLAIMIFFRREIFSIIFKRRIIFYIFIITLITGILGLFIEKNLKEFMERKYFVSICFFINSMILLFFSNNKDRKKRDIEDINLKDSVILGIFQGLAVFYGISRSGITISWLLRRKFKSEDSFTFSFLIGIPVMLGAFLLEFKGLSYINIPSIYLAITFVFTFFISIAVLHLLRRIIIINKFNLFGYYCLFIFFVSLFI